MSNRISKVSTGVAVFLMTSFGGAIAASAADYPPSGTSSSGTGASGTLPATGAALLSGPFLYANIALLLGLGVVGTAVIRRRSAE